MTGKIAPHLSCEVRLVWGGNKPLAVIGEAKDPHGFSLAIALANTGALAILIRDGEAIITTVKNRNLIPRYLFLLQSGVKEYGLKEYHRQMGRLFGYTEDDIRAFIEAEITCACTKCRGEPL